MTRTNQLTACEAAARIEAGTLTSETLVARCIDRIEARARPNAAAKAIYPLLDENS